MLQFLMAHPPLFASHNSMAHTQDNSVNKGLLGLLVLYLALLSHHSVPPIYNTNFFQSNTIEQCNLIHKLKKYQGNLKMISEALKVVASKCGKIGPLCINCCSQNVSKARIAKA